MASTIVTGRLFIRYLLPSKTLIASFLTTGQGAQAGRSSALWRTTRSLHGSTKLTINGDQQLSFWSRRRYEPVGFIDRAKRLILILRIALGIDSGTYLIAPDKLPAPVHPAHGVKRHAIG